MSDKKRLHQATEAKDAGKQSEKAFIRLRMVGFCGVDETFTDETEYKWPEYIEWGVLFRPELEGSKRFPKLEWVAQFVRDKKKLAAHLCSTRCEQILNGDATFVQKLFTEFGFKRFQINATKANNFDSATLGPLNVSNLVEIARSLRDAEFIVQRNDETKPLWENLEQLPDVPSNISYLFDASVGRGVVVSVFDKPANDHAKYGYAGGIKPENVEEIVRAIASKVPQHTSVWIDMESGIREKESDDDFSSKKAWKVCEVIENLRLQGIVQFES